MGKLNMTPAELAELNRRLEWADDVRRDLCEKVAQILVRNNLRTDQVAIGEIVDLILRLQRPHSPQGF